jgi:arylsulfotransferase ASST
LKGNIIARLMFQLSVVTTVFMWGFSSYHFKIFPYEFIKNAHIQAKNLYYNTKFNPHHLFPAIYSRSGVIVINDESIQPGITLVTSYWKELGWVPGVKLIDSEGNSLHLWKTDPSTLFPEKSISENYVHGTYLFPDGDLLLNIEYGGLVRLDACGKIKWKLDFPSTHHSISQSDDGNFWVSGNIPHLDEPIGIEYLKKYSGLKAPIYEDHVLKITPDGSILYDINMLDVIYNNNLQSYIPKFRHENYGDVFHLNDVEELSEEMADEYPIFEYGDIVVSLKNLNLVMVVNPDTKIVKWHTIKHFVGQHDPDFIGQGWIGVFDNNSDFTARGTMSGGTRILAVRPHTNEVKKLYPKNISDKFYTYAGGKWQYLSNGNMLLIEARAGRIIEVTQDGEIVWEWINERYQDSLIPEVLEATRYALTPEQVRNWSCE